jgi:hypothetical protein
MLDPDEEYTEVPIKLLEKWRSAIVETHMDRLFGDIIEDITNELSSIEYPHKEPEDIHKKKEFCMDCKYWDNTGDGMQQWNGCGYCRHGPPTAGCKNQVSDFPITSEYGWCWQWHKIDDDRYIGGI